MEQKRLKFNLEQTVQTTFYNLKYNKMVFNLEIKEFFDTSEYIKTNVSITGHFIGHSITLDYALKKHYSHSTLALGALQRILKL